MLIMKRGRESRSKQKMSVRKPFAAEEAAMDLQFQNADEFLNTFCTLATTQK